MRPDVSDMVLGVDGRWLIRPPEKCVNRHRLAGRCIVEPCRAARDVRSGAAGELVDLALRD
jgi:hypothetical protein